MLSVWLLFWSKAEHVVTSSTELGIVFFTQFTLEYNAKLHVVFFLTSKSNMQSVVYVFIYYYLWFKDGPKVITHKRNLVKFCEMVFYN